MKCDVRVFLQLKIIYLRNRRILESHILLPFKSSYASLPMWVWTLSPKLQWVLNNSIAIYIFLHFYFFHLICLEPIPH